MRVPFGWDYYAADRTQPAVPDHPDEPARVPVQSVRKVTAEPGGNALIRDHHGRLSAVCGGSYAPITRGVPGAGA